MLVRLRAFWDFWYDFIVGDDWTAAVGVVLAFAVTYAISRTSVPAWWVAPAFVALLLPIGIWRAARPSS